MAAMEDLEFDGNFSREHAKLDGMYSRLSSHLNNAIATLEKLKGDWHDANSDSYISNWTSTLQDTDREVSKSVDMLKADLDEIARILNEPAS